MGKNAIQPEMIGNLLVKKPEKNSCLNINKPEMLSKEESTGIICKPPCIKIQSEARKNKKYDGVSLVLGSKQKSLNTKKSNKSVYEYDDCLDDDLY